MTNLSELLLKWYQKNGRYLPWRVKGRAHHDAYAVWVSEIMLQQTTVKTVLDYFDRWMTRFPTLSDLAGADIQDVLLMWQGLGYYTRAKKMHECAKVLVEKYDGQFPSNRSELLKLPGIGPYTASSICAFAFNLPETVVDGNVIRVIARLYGITTPIDKEDIYKRATALTSQKHGADYASAIMDLGATVCT
ncbi:MAG: A/G-specific adenine glycosylase, partial [Alphaproteobacteria bacterium]|nr:A/G-specific adenine glycosylase [Alphaproteobacteria bacterium]